MHNYTHLFVCIYHSKFQYIFSYVNTNTSRSNAVHRINICLQQLCVEGDDEGSPALRRRDP